MWDEMTSRKCKQQASGEHHKKGTGPKIGRLPTQSKTCQLDFREM